MSNTRMLDDRNSVLLKNKYSPYKGPRVSIQVRLTADVAARLEADRRHLSREVSGLPSISFVLEEALRRHYGLV